MNGAAQAKDAGIALYWNDDKPDFDAQIGPWLVQLMTGQQPVNMRGEADRAGLATAGTPIDSMDRPGLSIWGSGLARILMPAQIEALAKCKPAAIHAVRGALSREDMIAKLGWTVPDVLGDPALLLPRYHTPAGRPKLRRKTAFVLDRAFRSYVDKIDKEILTVVNAQAPAEKAVERIANSACCVSTSLCGVIVAQAFGVPWVWLRVTGEPLPGGDFPFEDFFTVLARAAVRIATIDAAAVSTANILALGKFAFLPKLTIDLDVLQGSFPIAT